MTLMQERFFAFGVIDMAAKFGRVARKGSNRHGSDATSDRESLARENEHSGRYTAKDYPGDSYYTLQQIYREYVKSGKNRRRDRRESSKAGEQ